MNGGAGPSHPQTSHNLEIARRASATQSTPPGRDDLKWVANTTTLVCGERDAFAGRYISLRRANRAACRLDCRFGKAPLDHLYYAWPPRPFLWPETAARSLPRGSCTCHAPGGGCHASRTSTGVGCASRPRRSGSWFTAKHYRKETILGNRLRGIEGRGSPKRYRLVSTGVITRLIP